MSEPTSTVDWLDRDGGSASGAEPRPLTESAPGSRVTVVGFAEGGEPAVIRRLHDLGFTPGAVVEVVRRAPLRDPVLYRLRDYEVCLRRAEARLLRVSEAHR